MSDSPTFCAYFADSEKVRMSVWHAPDRKSFDLRRGVKLARAAYETRVHNRECRIGFDGPPVAVPAITEAHYEDDGAVLEQYDAAQLAEIVS
jgi:hypothetical protein